MLGRLLLSLRAKLSSLTHVERAVLVLALAVRLSCVGWGLPASDTWDVDGIAPRDFLPGLIESFTPGHYFTYPPLHLLFLAGLTLPVSIVGLATAPSLSAKDLVAAFIDVRIMTAFAIIARLTSVAMSMGTIIVLGAIASELFGKRARVWAMAFAGIEVAGAYYGRTTNLDVPYLFWASCALWVLVRAVKQDHPRALRTAAILAAAAIATKDQAYAVFLVSLPATLLLWLFVTEKRRELLRHTALAAVVGIGLVLALDGAITNPTGFAARLRFLSGPASQDFAQYSADSAGRMAVLRDIAAAVPLHYAAPLGVVCVAAVSLTLAWPSQKSRDRVARLVPLLAMVSFTLAFNCVARRVEERFMLPQMQFASVYIASFFATTRWGSIRFPRILRLGLVAAGVTFAIFTLRLTSAMIATTLSDTRYDAEAFLRAHAAPGDTIEVYSSNVYLPRFPAELHVERIATTSPESRGPLPNVIERHADVSEIEQRRPRWIFVSSGYVWRFLQPRRTTQDGRALPTAQERLLDDSRTTEFFHNLFNGKTRYRFALAAHYEGSRLLPARPLHASLACDAFVFERTDTPQSSPALR